jgi:hypothetical protein
MICQSAGQLDEAHNSQQDDVGPQFNERWLHTDRTHEHVGHLCAATKWARENRAWDKQQGASCGGRPSPLREEARRAEEESKRRQHAEGAIT